MSARRANGCSVELPQNHLDDLGRAALRPTGVAALLTAPYFEFPALFLHGWTLDDIYRENRASRVHETQSARRDDAKASAATQPTPSQPTRPSPRGSDS